MINKRNNNKPHYQNSNPFQIKESALEYLKNDFSVIPLNYDKTPTGKWKEYQTKIMPYIQAEKVFDGAEGVGLVCGKISENIEVIDVDCKYDITGTLWEDFSQLIKDAMSEEFFEGLVISKTQHNGYHIFYRCITVEGNKKLAQRPATDEELVEEVKDKVKVLLETRGEGGYAVLAPTRGYEWIQGSFENIKNISPSQRNKILSIARSFDEITAKSENKINSTTSKNKKTKTLSPLDDYNERGNCLEVLINHGWAIIKKDGERTFLLRPGQTESKVSANYHHTFNKLWVFSTSTEFETNRSYSPADIYALLECDGDIKKAVKQLYEEGYGDRREDKESDEIDIYTEVSAKINALDIKYNDIDGVIELNGDPLKDSDVSMLMCGIREEYGNGGKTPNKSTCEDIVVACAQRNKYNPFEDFVKNNTHLNSTENIDKIINSISGEIPLLPEGLNTRDYNKLFIRKWLLGMMSNIFDKHSILTLVFVGHQGGGKTKWFRELLPKELEKYFAEAKFDEDKDHQILLATKAIILDDEFMGKTRKEAGLFKKLASTESITIRKPYEKRHERYRRIATLCGTTNETDIFNDPTGNRRIIPVQVDSIDWDIYNSVDKKELFMELYREWLSVEDTWMLTTADIEILNNHSGGYESVNHEEELIKKYFLPPNVSYDLRDGHFTMSNTEILDFLQGRLHGGNIKLSNKKLGAVLKKLGYQQKMIRNSRLYAIAYNGDGLTEFNKDSEKDEDEMSWLVKNQVKQIKSYNNTVPVNPKTDFSEIIV